MSDETEHQAAVAQDTMMTIDEVAVVLRCKPNFVRKLTREGKLGCYRMSPKMVRVSAYQLEQYLASTMR